MRSGGSRSSSSFPPLPLCVAHRKAPQVPSALGGFCVAMLGQGHRAVWLQADTDKLIVAAPTQINMIVQADGTMTGPSAAATQIKNGSAFGIHVSKIQTTAKNSFALESTAKANDSASVTITPGAGTAVNLADTLSGMAITSGTDWNMAKVGATGADINLATVGKLSNITKDLAANQQFAQIDWTFAAGNTK